jgi:RHS repeat-associated protein
VESDVRYYVFGNYIDEVLVSVIPAQAPNQDLYYAHDHLYSPVALLDDTGAVVERYEYDVYGKVHILAPNCELRTASLYGNPYAFTGRELDTLDAGSLRLMHYRARTYDPDTGRFMQRDPLGVNPAGGNINPFNVRKQYSDGANVYVYVMNNPIRYTDFYGTSPKVIVAPVVVTAAACVTPHVMWWRYFAEQNNDKYAHCVVSCRVSKSCGHLMSLVAGYGKELRDEIAQRLGYDDIGWDPEDIVANAAGRECAGWISWVPGPISWTIQCFRKTCNTCCAELGYVNQ